MNVEQMMSDKNNNSKRMHVYSHVVPVGRKYKQTPSSVNDYHNITLTIRKLPKPYFLYFCFL